MKNKITVETSDVTITINEQKFSISKEDAKNLYDALAGILKISPNPLTDKIANSLLDTNKLYEAQVKTLQQVIVKLEEKINILTLKEKEQKPDNFPWDTHKFPWGNPSWPNTDKPWTFPSKKFDEFNNPILENNNLLQEEPIGRSL